jgi:hypothetical protein
VIKRSKKIFAISSLLFLTACAGLSGTPPYLAVVDAGSSGSRVHFYRVVPDDAFIDIQELLQLHPPGLDALSSFEGHAEQAGPQGIQPLLAVLDTYLASNHIPKSQVPVDVLATAGMRLLAQTNPTEADAIYRSVHDTIAGEGYRVGEIRTISGTDEGLYSWADVNYLYRNFHLNKPTKGIIEVGGASAQVAYVTSDVDHPNVVVKTINGVGYPILSVSYLGLGQGEARKAMIAASGPIRNPCYPNNDIGSPPTSFNADTGSPSHVVASGAYQYNDCNGLYQSLIASFHVRESAVAPGFDVTNFVGVSSVFFALHDWQVLDQPAMLGTRVGELCDGRNAWSLKVAPAQGGASKFAQNACANGTYINALLFSPKNGLGLANGRLAGVERIKGASPTWTRGYVVIRNGR